MTESAAITLYLAQATGDLVPPPHRPQFLRWLVFVIANIYPTQHLCRRSWTVCSGRGGAESFRGQRQRLRAAALGDNEAQASAPWFLGAHFTALDLFIAVMTKWRPTRAWFKTHAPRLHAIALAAQVAPQIAEVWSRNFPDNA